MHPHIAACQWPHSRDSVINSYTRIDIRVTAIRRWCPGESTLVDCKSRHSVQNSSHASSDASRFTFVQFVSFEATISHISSAHKRAPPGQRLRMIYNREKEEKNPTSTIKTPRYSVYVYIPSVQQKFHAAHIMRGGTSLYDLVEQKMFFW